MKIVIDLEDECIKKIEKVRFLLGGKEDMQLQIHVINAINNGTPLPKGHGDLIDRTEVIKSLFDYHNGKKTIGQCIDNVPTIIEADKAESEETE